MVGIYKGGYIGFFIDILVYLKEGKNLVVVWVNNCWCFDFVLCVGEYVFSGGIYWNVCLVIKFFIYIDWYGIWIIILDLVENKGKLGSVYIWIDVCNVLGKIDIY